VRKDEEKAAVLEAEQEREMLQSVSGGRQRTESIADLFFMCFVRIKPPD